MLLVRTVVFDPKKALSSMVNDWAAVSEATQVRSGSDTDAVYEALGHFDPFQVYYKLSYLEIAERQTTAEKMVDGVVTKLFLGKARLQFPKNEFINYLKHFGTTTNKPSLTDDANLFFWESADTACKYPLLTPIARKLMWLPCAVTQCDSAISELESYFSAQQNSATAPLVASWIFRRLNGDPLGIIPGDDVPRFAGDRGKPKINMAGTH